MTSPFSEGRFEYDAKHCFYLPKDIFGKLELHKPVYLIGSRGSGKTTLLMSLNWRVRMANQTLLRQLGNDPFRGRYIGTYVKLPKIQLSSFDRWLAGSEEDIHGMLLGLYFDLVFVEKISKAVADMLADGILNISSSNESDVVTSCVQAWTNVLPSMDPGSIKSVASLHQATRGARQALEHLARTRASLDGALKQFAPEQIGTLGTTGAQHLADLCNRDQRGIEGGWHFKVCMDEGECLTAFQQLVVNTIVRLAEWPLFPVVSYVSRPPDITTTLVPHLMHQKADRIFMNLDAMKRSDFIDLAEGVASVRCQEELNDEKVVFKAAITLGRLNINGLLTRVIEKSENPTASMYIEDAKTLSSRTKDGVGSVLPIYQAYLAKKLDLPLPPPEDRDRERHQDSQQYRKKMVAAYLSICRELRVRHVPYASADMVFGISDNCVRDFLSQIDHVFQESGLTTEEFVRTEIDVDKQDRALRAASKEKRDSIPESGVLSPVETGRFVKGLAMLTAIIQSSSEDDSHLRSTERGLFRFAADQHQSGELHEAMRLVGDAADAGFLRVSDDDGNDQLFRVHASLSPAYGFSYRGAYYPVTLTLKDFERLKKATTETDLVASAKAIANSLRSETDDLPLFPGEETNDDA